MMLYQCQLRATVDAMLARILAHPPPPTELDREYVTVISYHGPIEPVAQPASATPPRADAPTAAMMTTSVTSVPIPRLPKGNPASTIIGPATRKVGFRSAANAMNSDVAISQA